MLYTKAGSHPKAGKCAAPEQWSNCTIKVVAHTEKLYLYLASRRVDGLNTTTSSAPSSIILSFY